MKKVLLIYLLLIGLVCGCSNSEDNIPVDDYSTTDEWKLLAQDSTYIYYASINDEFKKRLVKERRSDMKIIWKKDMIIPDPVDIYLGYGEYKTVAFEPSSGYPFFDNDNLLLCKWSGLVNISMGLKCSAECIVIYNLDGDLISSKYICNDGAYNYNYENAAIRYGDSIIIGKNNGYFIIDKNGKIIEENNHIHLAGLGNPDAIFGRKYVLVDWNDGKTSYGGMSIFDLDKGRTDIDLSLYINNKYKHPSKINYTNISTNGNKMVIFLKITFYDNTTIDEKITVDIDLAKIIE